MDRNLKILIGLGVVAVSGYLLIRKPQSQQSSQQTLDPNTRNELEVKLKEIQDLKSQISQPQTAYKNGDIVFKKTGDQVLVCDYDKSLPSPMRYVVSNNLEKCGGSDYWLSESEITGFTKTSQTVSKPVTQNSYNAGDLVKISGGKVCRIDKVKATGVVANPFEYAVTCQNNFGEFTQATSTDSQNVIGKVEVS